MPLVLRLAEVLREHKNRLGGYKHLSAQLGGVDWRKLKALVEGGDYSLKRQDFERIHSFLLRVEGKALLTTEPLFTEGLSPLRALLAQGSATIFVGARLAQPENNRLDVSYHDVRALAELTNQMQRATHFSITLLCRHADAMNNPRQEKELCELLDNKGPNLCSLGSPRSNELSNRLMSLMFGLKGSFTPGLGSLPFRFLWPNSSWAQQTQSPFTVPAEEASDPELRDLVQRGEAYGLLMADGKQYTAHRKPRQGMDTVKDYAIVMAQRRGARVVLVLMGLSGPATWLAAAHLADDPTLKVPESSTLWAVYECEVPYSLTAKNTDPRSQPRDWHRIDRGEWDSAAVVQNDL